MAEHLAAHFRTMSRGARQLNLGSWEDTFWDMAERASRNEVTSEELAELVDYDYRAGNDDPKAGAATLFAAVLKDASAPSLKEENERLRAALDELNAKHARALLADKTVRQTVTRAGNLAKECGELRALVQAMINNDPDDMVADGVTVLDAWRKAARAALGKPEEMRFGAPDRNHSLRDALRSADFEEDGDD